MTNTIKKTKEPLIHISRRTDLSNKKKILIYVIGLVVGLVLSSILCALSSEYGDTPIDFFIQMFEGCFGTKNSIETLIRDTAMLLAIGLALVPAFKMKFWNLGGNGQILIGSLAAIMVMFYMGGKAPDIIVNVLSLIAAVVAGAIWAGIPAVCKAFFNTNETLFTLMMNYIASGLVTTFICATVKTQSGTFPTLTNGLLPVLGNKIVLPVLVIALITVFMYFYMKKSKHGFELSLVGESPNTARYVGINVKKVVIRTIVLSGAICGLVGMLLVAAVTPSITVNTAKNMGFTACMSSWLGAFDPIIMIVSSFFVVFASQGMKGVKIYFHFSSDAIVNVVLGILFFAIIACEFFVNYNVIIDKNSKIYTFFTKIFKKKVKEEI